MVSPTVDREVVQIWRDVEGAVPYLTPWGCPPVRTRMHTPLTREQDKRLNPKTRQHSLPSNTQKSKVTFP